MLVNNNGFVLKKKRKKKKDFTRQIVCVYFRSFRCDQCVYIFHLFLKDEWICCQLIYCVDFVKSSGAINSEAHTGVSMNC